jgi:1,4-alpha-glucan branching enzyme
MSATQEHVGAQTRTSATLTAGRATFRVFRPSAVEVFVSGDFNGWKQQDPALRRAGINVFHVHNANRVIAFQRWLEGVGRDVVVVVNPVDLPEICAWLPRAGLLGRGLQQRRL